MPNFICKRGHVTTLPDRKEIIEQTEYGLVTATHDLGIDHDNKGEYIMCGWFKDEDEETDEEVIQSKHDLSKVRAHIKDESNYMNAMEADHLDEWSCSEKAYKN